MDRPSLFSLRRPDATLAMRGLYVLMAGPEPAPNPPHTADLQEKLDGFLAYAASIRIDLTRQVLAFRATGNFDPATTPIAGMCLWVPGAGRTAMLFAPSISEFPHAAPATELTIAGALDDARAHGIVLAQAMMEPADAAGKTTFAAAGLTQLATLTYMERRPPLHPPAFQLPTDLSLAPYDAGTHPLFRDAILASYTDTLDCPAMSGMRDVDDVIEGHKAVGLFDPQLWAVLLQSQPAAPPKPVGCLLLSEIPARRALELVYLGLAPEVRGRGLGRILMHRVMAISARRHFDLATLAVDAANLPASRLYRRAGFTSVAQRVALIKRLS